MRVRLSLTGVIFILILSTLGFAAAPDRITSPILAGQMVRLEAGAPRQARSEFDQGAVDLSFQMSYMTLLTAPSARQKAAIDRLLADQQNPHSPSYHKWLTPEQYADRFGLSRNDVKHLSDWLQSQGFTVVRTARARNWIAFSGTAEQVERTFQTQIRNYKVDGEMHFANTVAPKIPAALSGVVTGIRGLHNFRLKKQARRAQPDYTFTFQGSNFLFASPGDIATIYDVNPLYTNGIDGTGQSVGVIGQTGIFQSDLNDFRQGFGIPPINCTVSNDIITACNTTNFKYILVNGSATHVISDLDEADIDLEWSNAVARKSKIIFITATDPAGNGIFDSIFFAIDNVVSPVLTLSYTSPCEFFEIGFFDSDEAELQQANAEGITFMNSSGDTGAAACDFQSNFAFGGYAAAYPASSQYVTGVGGTSIPAIAPNEYSSTFWNPTNTSDGGSAKGYIPEQPWNDAQEIGLLCSQATPPSNCGGTITDWASAQENIGISSGGGGVSNCVTVDDNDVCTSGFPQPVWQQGIAIPGTIPGQTTSPARLTPDVSLLGSPNFPGYIVCSQINGPAGGGSSCAGGITAMLNACFNGTGPCTIFGGTSVSSPVFAGMVALMNQQVVTSGIQDVPGLGNINPTLYALAATPGNGVFNPVTTASTGSFSNGAFCSPGSPSSGFPNDPWPVNLVCPESGFLGFSAFNFDPTTKYNLVTGLGSVNASHLAAALVSQGQASTQTDLGSSANPVAFGSSVTFTADVTTTSTSTPTGVVTFKDGATTLGTSNLTAGPGIITTAHATFATSTLSPGSHSITAAYAGDTNNAASTSAILPQVVTAPTFTLTNQTALNPATVLSGQSSTMTLKVTATSGGTFAGDVTFSCSGLPDTTVTCSAPTIAAGTTSPVTETVTFTTTGPNTNGDLKNLRHRRSDNRVPWMPLTLPLAGIVAIGFAGRKHSKYSVAVGLCISLALLGFLVACGSDSHPAVVVNVSPAGSTLFANNAADGWPPQTAPFTATVSNNTNTAVTWSVSPAGAGTIDANGVYTAPTIVAGLPGSATITATSQADSTKTAHATVTITPTTVPGVYNAIVITAAESTTTVPSNNVTLTVQ